MNEIKELLRQLVAIPSVNPGFEDAPREYCNESRIASFIAEWAEREGIHIREYEAAPGRNCVLLSVGPEGGETLTVSSHLDTVWTPMEEPFLLKEDPRYLYGLGVLDDKGPFAAALMALKRLKGKKLTKCFQVMGTCDEEYGLIGIKYMVPEFCRPSALIIGEPTGMKIIRCHKGSNRFTFRTRGVAVHSSLVPRGENAIYKAAKIITALEEYGNKMLKEPGHPLLGTDTLSVGVVKGGTQPSFVPDECSFTVNYRSLPRDTKEYISHRLEEAANAAGVDYEITMRSFDAAGLDTPEDQPLIRAIKPLLEKASFDPVPGGLPCATESFRAAEFGIPAIVWGPGEMDTAHTAGERMEKDQLEAYCQMLCEIAE